MYNAITLASMGQKAHLPGGIPAGVNFPERRTSEVCRMVLSDARVDDHATEDTKVTEAYRGGIAGDRIVSHGA